MSEFQQGKTNGVYSVGSKVDDLCETYEKESQTLEAMKLAFGNSVIVLDRYKHALLKDQEAARVPVKEASYGTLYIGRCADLLKKMYDDSEAKRLQAVGAIAALKQCVATIKELYDAEQLKLKQQQEFEKKKVINLEESLKTRPIGVNPGNPIEELKKKAAEKTVPVVEAKPDAISTPSVAATGSEAIEPATKHRTKIRKKGKVDDTSSVSQTVVLPVSVEPVKQKKRSKKTSTRKR